MAGRSAGGWSRRRFLGAVGGSFAIATCGVGDDGRLASGPPETGPGLELLVPPTGVLVATRPQRLPVALVEDRLPTLAGPDRLTVVIRSDGAPVDRVEVEARQHFGNLRYYPVRTTFPAPGRYDLVTDDPDWTTRRTVEVADPDELTIPTVGDPFPAVQVPTVADPRGIEPLCSQRPEPCGLHHETPRSLLDRGQVFLVVVATPRFARSTFCGPALFHVTNATAEDPDLAALHLEVYENPLEVDGDLDHPELRRAAAVRALGVGHEPALFVVGADGRVRDRLDGPVDRAELDAAVAAAR